jgi:hypothetical protein
MGAAVAGIVLMPALVTVAAIWDLRSRDWRLARTRSTALILVYVFGEAAGIVAAFLARLWPHGMCTAKRLTGGSIDEVEARYATINFRLQCWWASFLFAAAHQLLGLRPAAIISARHGIRLRWVMKRELLWDPCLDIVGNRLPNAFIRHPSG